MCVPLERFKFQLVKGPQNRSLRNSLTQTFAESCVDFEVAHLSVE